MNVRFLVFSLFIVFIPLAIFIYIIAFAKNAPDSPKISFSPLETKLYTIGESGNADIFNVLATTLPKFGIILRDNKFSELWKAHAEERKKMISGEVSNVNMEKGLPVTTEFDEKTQQVIVTPLAQNKVKPGLYTLNIKVKTYKGEEQEITQDFTWGVLAVNTNKGMYKPGDTVSIGMAVLDDQGKTKCIAKEHTITAGTAKVWLSIISPSGNEEKFSTEDETIKGSSECIDRNKTYIPDFLANTKVTEEGKYILKMDAETIRGRRNIESYFIVKNTSNYDIERVQYPMRIYPRSLYPVVINVTANEDYEGIVYDKVPESFTITNVSDYGLTRKSGVVQSIEWNVNWKKGRTYQLKYTIKFPPVTPEFYLVGPFTIGSFHEGREWQVASDSIFLLVQEAHSTATTGTSLTATFSLSATPGNLLILICARDQNTTINTPSGYTRRYRYTSNSPRLSHFDRIVPASPAISTGTCSFSSNGSIATTFLEFSGNSSSGYFDKVAGPTRATTCNTGAHQSTGSTITPTNPDELLVSAFVSTAGNLSVSSHKAITGVGSSGFTDTDSAGQDGFSDANASYSSGWGEAVNNPVVAQNDVATFSGAATACTQGVVAYNAQITVSQGSYQFFDNTDSVNPTTVFSGTATENSPITLNNPNQQFRLRMLLDIDSTTGSLGKGSGDWILNYGILPASGDCADATYSPVATSSAIAYNVNPSTAGQLLPNISATANDPSDTPTYTTVLENYIELYLDDNADADVINNQNAIANNQAGLFDFSLVDATDDAQSYTYCLKITDPEGGDLAAYRNYPKVTTIINDVVIRGGSTIRGGTDIR